jgi:hypothetical protein
LSRWATISFSIQTLFQRVVQIDTKGFCDKGCSVDSYGPSAAASCKRLLATKYQD